VCGVAFPDVQRVPQHVSEELEHEIDWDEILREWAR
jgi:hypothetical protein